MSTNDLVLAREDRGLYEVPLRPAQPVVLHVSSWPDLTLQVMHVDGEDPLYVGLGVEQLDVVPTDRRARMVLPGQWIQFELREYTRPYPVTVVCRSAAVVSLVRV